jgi:hypothetical protein
LLGIFLGVALAIAEGIGEGGLGSNQANRFVAIVAIFVILEASGVLIGYVFLAKPLGLFRHNSREKGKDERSIQE